MNKIIDDTAITLGSFEHVSLPGLKLDNIVAKIDTGAYSGAIHCKNIKVIYRKADGVKVLRFTPSEHTDNVIEIDHFWSAKVRSSSGHSAKRYLIETDIIIKDKRYTIRVGLTNRSDMQYEVLIGRRFLRKHNMLVDVRINQELDKDGGGKI
jgi:hypothetical protein